jgi:DNA adenine methylase
MFSISSRTRPVLKWAGGKSALLPQLISNFPDKFDRYVEPFLGGGAVFLSLRNPTTALINDANPELVNLYSIIRDEPEALMAALDGLQTNYSEAFYYQMRSSVPDNDVACAARTIFLNKTGFNGLYRQNSKGIFNVPFGKRMRCPVLYRREALIEVSHRLKCVAISNVDFASVIAQAGAGDFVYCDPPYEPLSASSNFSSYIGPGFSRVDQKRLRDACVEAAYRGARVAISNSSAPFILDLYSEWDCRMVLASRNINSKGSGRGVVSEVLVIK